MTEKLLGYLIVTAVCLAFVVAFALNAVGWL